MQSIIIAHLQYYLPLINWPKNMLQAFMAEILEHFWCSKHAKKGLRLLSQVKLCSHRLYGGMNVLDLKIHTPAMKTTLLPTLMEQIVMMLAHMSMYP